MKQMMIDVPNCNNCPNVRNAYVRLYCFTCSAMDNKTIHTSNHEVDNGFIPDWCPLQDKGHEDKCMSCGATPIRNESGEVTGWTKETKR